jgi:hypothetical protein
MCEYDMTKVVTGVEGRTRQLLTAQTAIALLAAQHVRDMIAQGWHVSYDCGNVYLTPGTEARR